MNLYNYFLTQQGRRIIKNAHYFAVYERYFSRFVDRPLLMFEIGTGEGGSALMWKRYFGPLARIVTVDIRDCSHIQESQIYPRTGSQGDPHFLESLVEEFGAPDIVLDDGSHLMPDVTVSFNTLYPKLKSDGIYMVEDLNTAYWPHTGGGLRAPTSFIEKAKGLIDEMHAAYTNGALSESEFTRSVFSITFFDMMVVIEKAPYINKDLLHLPAA